MVSGRCRKTKNNNSFKQIVVHWYDLDTLSTMYTNYLNGKRQLCGSTYLKISQFISCYQLVMPRSVMTNRELYNVCSV